MWSCEEKGVEERMSVERKKRKQLAQVDYGRLCDMQSSASKHDWGALGGKLVKWRIGHWGHSRGRRKARVPRKIPRVGLRALEGCL